MCYFLPNCRLVDRVRRDRKNNDKFKNLPVILVTFKDRESDTFRGMKQRADEYPTKLFEPEDLMEAIKKMRPVPGGGPFGLY
jgi:DNA-binding response OmpR family regulator